MGVSPFWTAVQTPLAGALEEGAVGRQVILRAASGLTRQELCAICTDGMAGGEEEGGQEEEEDAVTMMCLENWALLAVQGCLR